MIGPAALREGLTELVARGGGVGPGLLLSRALMWRAARITGLSPVVRVHGQSRMRLTPRRGDHGISTSIFYLRDGHEPALRALIDRTLAPGQIAADIGANMGLWTLRMAECVGPTGRVLAVEPARAMRERLSQNLTLSGLAARVDIAPVALSGAEGQMTLHTPSDPGSASLGKPDGAVATETVTVRTFDALWQDAGCPEIALVKIDVEGAETMVLAGATRFFDQSRPVVACEINPKALARLGGTPEDVIDFFLSRGYRAFAWDHGAGDFFPHDPDGPDLPEDLIFFPAPLADRIQPVGT